MESFEACLQLARADAKVRRRLEVQGLSLHDLAVLYHLMTSPGRTLRRVELAERLGLSASGVTRLLAPLEKQAYVTRRSDPNDARLALVTLTEPGLERTREALEVAEERADDLLGDTFGGDERATLTGLLSRLAPLPLTR